MMINFMIVHIIFFMSFKNKRKSFKCSLNSNKGRNIKKKNHPRY